MKTSNKVLKPLMGKRGRSGKNSIVITCGDPAGIGPEIIHDWWMNHADERKSVAIIGPQQWLSTFEGAHSAQLIAIGNASFNLTPGIPTEEGARIAFEALALARMGCAEGIYQGVVTAPVSKEWLKKVGFDYPGQTEYFSKAGGRNPVMAFVGEKMVVSLATSHIPLEALMDTLDPVVLYRTICETYELLRSLGVATPRIAVCGLNPHAGENGLLGSEEKEWINPVLDKVRPLFSGLSNALPADTVFYRHLRGEFDAVVALYHDQGLAPLKTVEFDTAVNVTLGLPFVRTSPTHGTAFDIAGKGLASGNSFAKAVALARKLISVRN